MALSRTPRLARLLINAQDVEDEVPMLQTSSPISNIAVTDILAYPLALLYSAAASLLVCIHICLGVYSIGPARARAPPRPRSTKRGAPRFNES